MRSLRIGSRPFQSASAEAQALLDVAEAGHAVLAPAVGAGAGVVVGEVGPRLAVGAVVLADGAPLALAEVRAPQVPVAGLPQAVLELAEPLDPRPLSARHRPTPRRRNGSTVRTTPGAGITQ